MKMMTVLATAIAFSIEDFIITEQLGPPGQEVEVVYVGDPQSYHYKVVEVMEPTLVVELDSEQEVYGIREGFFDRSKKGRGRTGGIVVDTNPEPFGIVARVECWDSDNPQGNKFCPTVTLGDNVFILAEGFSNSTVVEGSKEVKRYFPEYLLHIRTGGYFTVVHPVTGKLHRFTLTDPNQGVVEVGAEEANFRPVRRRRVPETHAG